MQQQGTLGINYNCFKDNTLAAMRSANRVAMTVTDVVARVRKTPVENDEALYRVMQRVTDFKGISLSQAEQQDALRLIKQHLNTMPH